MKYLIFSLALIFVQCSKDEKEPSVPLLASGTFLNGFIDEGCDWHFRLNFAGEVKIYVADDDSFKSIVAPLIQMKRSPTWTKGDKVEVRFQLTYKKKKISCSFAGLIPMDEIHVLDIKVL